LIFLYCFVSVIITPHFIIYFLNYLELKSEYNFNFEHVQNTNISL
jgi:hypothetical protein